MPTKPRTKKPAAKPQRKTRADAAIPRIREVRKYNEEALARNIADALGRRLDDLLSVKQGTPVTAWQADERDERIVAGIVAGYAARDEPAPRTSPIEEAMTRLLQAVSTAECVTDTTADRLDDVLSPPTLADAAVNACAPAPNGASELASRLNVIADRIFADGRRRLDILNRLEL